MQVREVSADGLKHEFTVTVEANEIERKIADRLTEIGRQVRLPGFRPGKAPIAVLKKRYGPSVMGEVVERAVNDSTNAAIRERNLRPALQPKIEITSFNEGKDLEYKLAVEVLPEIGPVEFSTIALERWKPEIADAEIDKALERIAQQQRKNEKVERPAEKGDGILIDYKGTIDGVAFAGGAADNYSLELGSGNFVPGFEDQLVGSSAGDSRIVKLTFPADYYVAELAGKPAEFAVTIREVRKIEAQPIDESLATAVGMENLAELRKVVHERIAREYGGVSRQKLKRELLDALAARFTFAVPPGMVDIESEHRSLAERRVRLGLLLNEVGRANNLVITGEEINQALVARARSFPGQEKEVVDFYRNNPQALESLKAPVLEDKVVDYILERAKVDERAVKPEDLVAAVNKEEA